MDTVRGFLGNFSDTVSNQLTVGPSFLESGPLLLQPGLVWVSHTHLEAAIQPFLLTYLAWTMPIPRAYSTMFFPGPGHLAADGSIHRSWQTDILGDS